MAAHLPHADRGSALTHLGLRTPARRQLVKQGFSFTAGDDADVLAAWDRIWSVAQVADVMFTPLDYYRDNKVIDPGTLWPTVSQWIGRIDNWAHADDLARVYSRVLAAEPDTVYPTLVAWSKEDEQWQQRIAMVSLIRYTGKNVNFMPVDAVLDIVANCVADQRDTVTKAVGWVLRETMKADEAAVTTFMETHASTIAPVSRRRATGRR